MFDFLIGNGFLSSILAFIIVLIPAVIVHELGHFLAARAVGVTVLEFGIGLPPRVLRLFMWRETEFTLNLIPLGGFVRPFGEDVIQAADGDKPSDNRQQEEQDGLYSERQILAERGVMNPVSVYDVKPLPRIFFLIAGALANFVLALFVFTLVGLMGLPQEVGASLALTDVQPDSAFAQAGFQPDDFINEINGQYFNNQAEFTEQLTALQGQTATFTVRRLQPNSSYATVTLDTTVTPEFVDAWTEAYVFVRVLLVNENTPGDVAGLQVDDRIIGINEIDFAGASDPSSLLREATIANAGREVTLTFIRDGQTLNTTLSPRQDPPLGQGRIGIEIRGEIAPPDENFITVQIPQFDYVPQSLPVSMNYAITSTLEIFQLILEFPSRLIQGTLQPGEARVVSVVGVSQLGGEILQDSIQENNFVVFLRFIALISVALGITNLLPIPALDGGRIVFALIELIRGKPVAPEREGYVHMVGLIFLLSLGVLLIINDVINPVTDLLR